MLDPKLLRSDLPGVAAALARRGFVLDVEAFAALEEQRKSVQIEADRLRAERNASAKAVGFAKSKGEDVTPLLAAGEVLAAGLQGIEKRLELIQSQITDLQLGLPNILHASVPEGRDESSNVEVRRFGVPREFSFEPRDHVDRTVVDMGERDAALVVRPPIAGVASHLLLRHELGRRPGLELAAVRGERAFLACSEIDQVEIVACRVPKRRPHGEDIEGRMWIVSSLAR